MLDIIVMLIMGLVFAYFATQNTSLTNVQLGAFSLQGIPLYLVVLGAILLGVLISSIVSLINSIFTTLTIFGKDAKLKERNESLVAMRKRITELERENEHLRNHAHHATILRPHPVKV